MKQVFTDITSTYVEPKEHWEAYGVKYDPEKHYVVVDDTQPGSNDCGHLKLQGYVVETEVMDKYYIMSIPRKKFDERIAREQDESLARRKPIAVNSDQKVRVLDGEGTTVSLER